MASTMKFIADVLEDLHVDDVKCCICKHYLSVKPIVTNIQNGKSICGRCETSSNLFKPNHSFELLASQFIFPCMNTKEGCIIRRSFEDINKHEISCTYRILKCSCSWSGNPIELKTHYENKHKELVIKDGDTIKIANDYTCFLFKYQNLHFFVNCKCNVDHFSLEIVGLSNVINECKAIFICKLADSNLDFRIELNTVLVIPHTNKLPTFTLNSEISAESIDSITKSIVCTKCSVHMIPPILRCSKGHVTCIECTESWLDYCQICENESVFTCDPELECIGAASIFFCRWNCGNKFNANEIRDHEQSCEKRIYQCWVPWHCKWSGCLTELYVHNKTCALDESDTNHTLLEFDIFDVTFLGNVETNHIADRFLLTNNCRFNVRCEREDETTIVSIDCRDVYAYGRFRYTADISHLENSDFSFSKTYKLKHTGGLYSLDVPADDILQFGKDRLFKITVHITPLNEEERMIKTDLIYTNKFKNYRRLLFK